MFSTSALTSSLGRTFPPPLELPTLPKAAGEETAGLLATGAGAGAGAGTGAGAGAGVDLIASASASAALALASAGEIIKRVKHE